MARPLRLEFPGALFHVTSRGNARASIYADDSDRRLFLHVLGGVIQTHSWLCHAYCLMPNHYHLVVETPQANLSRGMRQLNGIYTQRYNRRHARVGHVFQGRFKGILVERESHLLELARYVVLNPVRAGLARDAEDYSWSSLRAALGLAPTPSWLSLRAITASFATRERYRAFVRDGIGAVSPWHDLRGSILGSDFFVESIAGRIEAAFEDYEVPRCERHVSQPGLPELFPPDMVVDRKRRNARIRELSRTRVYTHGEIAEHLGLHYSTVSRLASASGPGESFPPATRESATVGSSAERDGVSVETSKYKT